MKVIVLTLIVSLCAKFCLSLKTINLNGQWIVSNSNKSITIPGVVPGSMYTALIANNTIGDPYYRKNDQLYRWIGQDDWTYTRTFTLTSDILQYRAVVLVCEGLDTVSTVIVNNKTVGTSDNMFVRYVYDIKSALVVGENTIYVEFRSAPKYVEEIAKKRQYPILPLCVPPEYHGECGANLIRKTQCSFSWDWGPSFPTQGIWKDIYIQGYDTVVMRDVTSETTRNKDGSWLLKVDVFTDVPLGTTAQGHLEVKVGGTSVTQSIPVSLTPDNNTATMNINIPKTVIIHEWWPNGYGNQTLYDLFVFLTDSFGTMNNKRIRIGFRTVEIVEDYVSADKSVGRSFYFRVNGQALFLKGSNWIPADAFLERITRERVYGYLKSAADVHMNTMRVWGGGIYEFDMFYELADELGIMIWQDFMFACAMYPTDDHFLASVSAEVRHQLRRLKHHPSVIAFSGNNENEKALRQDWYGTDVNFTRYKNDYLKLYKDTVHSIVMQEDTSRPFLSSSPSNGIETQLEGWVAKQPWSTHYGDIHEYNYLVPFYDPSQFRIPRMSSEYGLQSFPSYETLEAVYDIHDMDYWSDLNDYRNHHPFGNVEMMAEAIQYLKLPNNPDRRQRFKDLIYVTQIDHAVGMKVQTEHYRRWQNKLDNEGQGNTMGALYWMLADIWQAPTWASIEYGGKWKMLHYFARHFFAPTLISPYRDGSDIDVFIVLDELRVKEVRHPVHHTLHFRPKSNPRPFSLFDISTWGSNQATSVSTNQINPQKPDEFSGNLYVEIYSWDSFQALYTWKIPFTVNSTAQSVFRHNVNDMISTSGCIRTKRCFLFFHFGDPSSGPTNYIPLSEFNTVEGISNATIQISDVQATSTQNEFTVMLTADAIAPFVWIEAYNVKGRFSDNGFLMLRNTMTLTFYAWETIDLATLKAALSIKSLMNMYH
ncbi:beta-mannosidase-like isoform X1 [Mercenaria mercenaria]|uniref:beta-mannosidase-like isoform X1 n=1 Tax=Mercenaria mercenaria TaxID=6596 RepID=UPI00234EACF3|nr:beta-mannosidase-like isoform X1 [Mercenaria mercenaria]